MDGVWLESPAVGKTRLLISTIKGLLGSGWMRRGAEMKAFLRTSKALVAAGDLDRDLGFET